jgi:hypothetical protein
MKNQYRFLSEDEFGKPCHRHQLLVKDKWVDMTGASTIADVLGKVLTWWASGRAVETLGWSNPHPKIEGKYTIVPFQERLEHLKPYYDKIKESSEEDYLELLDEAYKAHSVRLADSAEAGTDLHALLEEYVKQCINRGGEPEEYNANDLRVKEFSNFALEYIKRFIWAEAHMYDEDLFVGGISDCGVEMNDGSYGIIDFKSAKETYFNHFVQIGVYNLLLEKNGLMDKDGVPLKTQVKSPISKYFVIPFGAKEFTVHENTNVEELKKSALSCIQLYRAKANFEGK